MKFCRPTELKMIAFNGDICFGHRIFDWHGTPLIVEDCQDGEFFSEEEVWGSWIFDIANQKFIRLPDYLSANHERAVEEIDNFINNCHYEWISFDDDECLYTNDFGDNLRYFNETNDFYKTELEKYEKMNLKPEEYELPR